MQQGESAYATLWQLPGLIICLKQLAHFALPGNSGFLIDILHHNYSNCMVLESKSGSYNLIKHITYYYVSLNYSAQVSCSIITATMSITLSLTFFF